MQIQGQHDELHTAYTQTKEQLQKLQEYSNKLDSEMEKLEALETDENQGYESLSRKEKVYFIVQRGVTNNILKTYST